VEVQDAMGQKGLTPKDAVTDEQYVVLKTEIELE
jgi:hypothetical protein